MLRNSDRHANGSQVEAGFSLVELLIAMVVTLIVTGAVFGLMLSGQTAFRREPDLTDRQQSIRMAMDLVERDITTAGMGLPPSAQVFTNGLDSATVGVQSPYGGNPDELEMLGSDGSCPSLWICNQNVTVTTRHPQPTCIVNSPTSQLLLLSTGPLNGTMVWKAPGPPPAGVCPAGPLTGGPGGGTVGMVAWRFGLPAVNAFDEGTLTTAQAPRYQIRNDPSGVPDLWRSPTGGLDINGADNYQIVARAIEDLQVQYRNGGGVWANTPGVVTCPANIACPAANANTIVREVRITLTARALGANLQGASKPTAGATRAPRGQLTGTVSPRAALFHLTQVVGTPWN